jgi:diguanylate cyclase (GGDEF)-like protein
MPQIFEPARESSPNDTGPLAILLETELLRRRSSKFRHLAFPRLLEQRFEADTSAARARRLAAETWVVTLLYTFFLFGDAHAIPARLPFAIFIRCGIALPILITANLLLRRSPTRFGRESLIVLTAGVIAISSLVIYRDQPIALSASPQLGLLIALLVTNVVMRLRFPFAVASTLLCILSDVAFLVADKHLTHTDRLNWAVPLAFSALFILLAAYSLEREERVNFLLQLRHQLQSTELKARNHELTRLSAYDALTGLANRAAFERQFQALWELALTSRQPLSAVLIDIDHFKVVNDTQGHLYGDEVLKRVAALVKESLRGKHDFAARFGGEEFILLLPETDAAAAFKVAERLRTLVQLAGSPAPLNDLPQLGLWTTVSCGVATVFDPAVFRPLDLFHAADTALYAAKSSGRNCTFAAPGLGSYTSTLLTDTIITGLS